jgi:hypothetical protein
LLEKDLICSTKAVELTCCQSLSISACHAGRRHRRWQDVLAGLLQRRLSIHPNRRKLCGHGEMTCDSSMDNKSSSNRGVMWLCESRMPAYSYYGCSIGRISKLAPALDLFLVMQGLLRGSKTQSF